MADPLPPNAAPWPEDHEPTAFQRAVVDATRALAHGEIVTYGELAEEVGRPGAGQAVANVLRRAADLPWWRVVPADGRLYRSHAPIQGLLLEAEGHRIDEHRRVIARGEIRVRAARALALTTLGGHHPCESRPVGVDWAV